MTATPSAHRFALLTTCATFVLLLVGGVVHATGSSLACPDWPLCYGSAFPAMRNGVEYEHTHRLAATSVGILTIVLAVLLRRRHRDDPALGRLGLAALALVIVQGVLGGITVLLRLPLAVSTAHLATSMAFFGLLIYLVFRAWPRAKERPAPAMPEGLRAPVALATGAVYVQLVLGALVRHTASGLACNTDLPRCNGRFWPAWAEAYPWNGPAQLHVAHRVLALVVVLLVLRAALVVRRAPVGAYGPLPWILARAACALVAVQILLGAFTVWTRIGVVTVTAHLGAGALLFAACWALYLATGRWRGRRVVAESAAVERAPGARVLEPVGS